MLVEVTCSLLKGEHAKGVIGLLLHCVVSTVKGLSQILGVWYHGVYGMSQRYQFWEEELVFSGFIDVHQDTLWS